MLTTHLQLIRISPDRVVFKRGVHELPFEGSDVAALAEQVLLRAEAALGPHRSDSINSRQPAAPGGLGGMIASSQVRSIIYPVHQDGKFIAAMHTVLNDQGQWVAGLTNSSFTQILVNVREQNAVATK